MMIIFFKNRNRKGQANIDNRFEIALVKRQQLLAEAFQKETKKFSRKTLYIFLGVFCICFGTAFIRIGITAIKDNHPVVFADPKNVLQPGVAPVGKDYLNIQRQRKYIH